MLLTDPPYNVDVTGRTADALKIANDSLPEADFVSFLSSALSNASARMRSGAAFYVWLASTHLPSFAAAVEAAGLEWKQTIVWNKGTFSLGRQDYQWKHEPCLYGWKPGAAHYFVADRSMSTVWDGEQPDVASMSKAELHDELERLLAAPEVTVWDCPKPTRSADHPTMKPVTLMGRAVANSTRPGETVLDPFGGSGSTLLACEQAGRRCLTLELDPAYCDVILARWERATGGEARLL